MKYFQWPTNMYIIFVAPPGIVSKSTTVNIGMSLLRQVEGIKFGPDSITWQALIQELQNAHEMFKLNDGDELYHTMSAITCVCSEFGNFLDPRDRAMVDALVSLWDGQVGTWSKLTKTQGDNLIENPWINVIACTTPDWIAANFPEALIGGGFTSRCIFVYADKKRKLVPYPKFEVANDFDDLQLKLIQDLGHIANILAGEYKLTGEARKFGEDWYQKHYDNPPSGLVGERFGGYIARKQTHIHKLSMVLAAAQSDKLAIEKSHLEAAAAFVSTLELDMPKVFSRIGVNANQRAIKSLVYLVCAKGSISNVELYSRAFNIMSLKDYNDAMDGALAAGYVKRMQKGDDVFWVSGPHRPE